MREHFLRTLPLTATYLLFNIAAAPALGATAGLFATEIYDTSLWDWLETEDSLLAESSLDTAPAHPNTAHPNRLLSPAPNLSGSGAGKSSADSNYHAGGLEDGYAIVFEPQYSAVLSAEIISPIIKIFKRMGDVIHEGDELIEMDPRVYEALYEKARALVMKTETELAGQKELFADGLASYFELRDAEASYASAQSDFASATKTLNSTKILAPYDGKVVALFVEEGELPHNNVSRNDNRELIHIINDEILIGKMLLPSAIISHVRINDPITIHVKETGNVVTGHIKRISPVIDPTSATVKVDAEIDNLDQKLRGGMTGIATLGQYTREPPSPVAINLDEQDEKPTFSSDDIDYESLLEEFEQGFNFE